MSKIFLTFVHFIVIHLVILKSTSNNQQSDNEAICSVPKDECICQNKCANVPHDQMAIMDCLDECGFVFIPNAYNVDTLNRLRQKFFYEFTDTQRDKYCEIVIHLRGARTEYAMPYFTEDELPGFDEIIYNPLVVESSLNFLQQQLIENVPGYNVEENPIILDTITFIVAPGNSSDITQGYHRDGQYGIKLQVPLIDVGPDNGPIEMISYDYNRTSIKGDCGTIKGIAPIGTAILYQQNVLHRGTQNEALDIRPVIDVSFLNLDEHIIQDIFAQFTSEAADDMAKIQEVFVDYCDKSDNCPNTKKTYMKPKEWTKEEMFYKIEAIARAKKKRRTGQMPIFPGDS